MEDVAEDEQAVDVTVSLEGDDVVLTVGGKKRNLDDVDDSQFDSKEAEKDEAELVAGDGGFDLSDSDDADEPEQQVVSAGATADPVKDYLKQIGKVALLNAEQEVDLAKRIEAGLFAEEQLVDGGASADDFDDYEWIIEDGRRAKNHLLEANLRLVVSLAKRYTGRGMLFLDLIQEGNLGLIRAVEKFDYTKGYKFSTYATGGSSRRSPARWPIRPHDPHPGAHGRGHQQAGPRPASRPAAGPWPRALARTGPRTRHDPGEGHRGAEIRP